jgi:PAS domain S-box-containing protein
MQSLRIILLEDFKLDAELILRELRKAGLLHTARCVCYKRDFEQALQDFAPDVVLSDHKLPDLDASTALQITRQADAELPFILVTGALGEEVAVEIMQKGATDYILKDRLFRLPAAIRRACTEAEARRERTQHQRILEEQNNLLKEKNVALAESEERFRQLAEHIREAFWMTDVTKQTMLFISRGYEEIWGRPREILYANAMNWADAIHPEDRQRVIAAALSDQARGTYHELYRVVRPDGSIRWIEDRAFPIRDGSGAVYRIAGLAEDITERKAAEAEAAILAQAVQSAGELICITDLDDRFTFVNPAFENAFGYAPGELLGKTPDLLFADKNPPGLMAKILAATRRGGWRGEVLDKRKDGTEFPIFLSTSQIKDASGQVLGLIGVSRDITSIKLAEKRNTTLASLSHKLSAASTPVEAAQKIVDVAAELFGWDACYLHLYSRDKDEIIPILTLDSAEGKTTPVPSATFTLTPSEWMRHVLAHGPQLVHRDEAGPAAKRMEPFGEVKKPSACMMYARILARGESIGVISIQSYTTSAYTQQDLTLFQGLAEHCGNALHRISVTETLRQAEAKYRSLFENATEGIFQTTLDGRYISANPALAHMFGYASPAELVAMVANIEQQTFVSADQALALKKLLAQNDSVLDYQTERYRKDRTTLWTSINVRAVRDEAGVLTHYEGTVQDITRRKRALDALKESERKLRLLAENTSDVILYFDMDRNPVYSNPAVRTVTGYAFEEIQARKFVNWVHPHDQTRMLDLWERLYQGESFTDVEFRLVTKSGEIKWCSSTWGPMLDEHGVQIGVQGRERDITERKQLEQQLLETSADERRRVGHELHDGLGQFLAGLAFKAKTLEYSLAKSSHPDAVRAHELGIHIADAINQTRSIARGLDPVDIETIGLAAALQKLAADTENVFNIRCLCNCDAAASELTSTAALALYRITQESIHNALTHGRANEIEIAFSVTPRELNLKTVDNGIGFQEKTNDTPGMGMRVMEYRARSLGGRIKIQSSPEHGTAVECSIPRTDLVFKPTGL